MGTAMVKTYTNAGILKKAGKGLVMDIAGAEFFLIYDDVCALMNNQAAEVVNDLGEPEGVAWLSPVVSLKKADMTSMISRRIYVVPYRGFNRVLSGEVHQAQVKEYHSR